MSCIVANERRESAFAIDKYLFVSWHVNPITMFFLLIIGVVLARVNAMFTIVNRMSLLGWPPVFLLNHDR
jgi:hypothetical protein